MAYPARPSCRLARPPFSCRLQGKNSAALCTSDALSSILHGMQRGNHEGEGEMLPDDARSKDEAREMRECRSCNGCGHVLVDAEYDPTTGELVQEVATCFICRGAGRVPLFLYSTPRPRS